MDTTKKDEGGKKIEQPQKAVAEARLGLLKQRLKIAKAFCKKPHEAWKSYISEYEISDISDTEEVRDRVRIGYLFRRVESDLPAVFDDQPDLFIKGRGKYRMYDNYFDNVYDWLWDQQLLEERIEDAGVYFDLLGMAYVESPWVTETEEVTELQEVPVQDELGGQAIDPLSGQPLTSPQEVKYTVPIKDQPDASVPDPFKVFFSPETRFNTLLTYDNCPYYFKEHTMTKEEVKAKFGKDIEPLEILHTNTSEIDTELTEIKDKDDGGKDDIKRATVYEYYGCLPEEKAKGIQSKKPWSYKTEYHIWFTKNEELKAEECQYPVKPLLVLGNYGLANKFFKFGDAKHLTPLINELEQYRTQILRHTRKIANPKLLTPDTANLDKDALLDPNPGVIVSYTPDGTTAEPHYLQVGQLGSEVGVGVQQSRTDLEQTSGSFSLAHGSGVSQVKSPRGIETFSEASDRNVRRKRKKIARFIRELIKYQYKLCALNWDPSNPETQEIILGGEENPQVPPQEFIQVLGDDNILSKVDIEVESLAVNRVQQKQEALDLFDLASQHPDLFNLPEIARDLLQNGFNKKDADRYLISMDQLKAQAVQEFMMQIGQVSPELGGALAQLINQPNMMQMQQGQEQQGQFQPPEEEGGGEPQRDRPVSQTRRALPPLSQG